jgi:DNA-binding GntR family transcriptional regulator
MPRSLDPKPRGTRRLLRDDAHDAIRAAILDGTFAPGERLDDARLQRWLGISRTPIREAIIELQVEGLVEVIPQAHTRVLMSNAESIEQTRQATFLLLESIARAFGHTFPDEARATLLELVTRAEEALDERDAEAHESVRLEIFRALGRNCPNPALVRLAATTVKTSDALLSLAPDALILDWKQLKSDWSRMRRVIAAGVPVESTARPRLTGPPGQRPPREVMP